MGRGVEKTKPFRFVWNQTQAIATNVYLLLYPVGPLAGLLEKRPALYRNVFEALNRLKAEELKGEGRVYGGGLYKIEPRELGRISGETLLDGLPGLKSLFR